MRASYFTQVQSFISIELVVFTSGFAEVVTKSAEVHRVFAEIHIYFAEVHNFPAEVHNLFAYLKESSPAIPRKSTHLQQIHRYSVLFTNNMAK